MVRRHGWQLPAHTFQVVAITVFFLLVVAFYAFFAPFLGNPIFEYAAIGIYTPVAIAVFVLYVRCTRINPADPGIMSKFDNEYKNQQSNNHEIPGGSLPSNGNKNVTGAQSSPTSSYRGSLDGSNRKASAVGGANMDISMGLQRKSSTCSIGGCMCAPFAKDDCRKFDEAEQQTGGEDALFCTLCDSEVRKYSKHCRSCDKCVDGFDHHCRWLNNCVGRKNYVSFIALMATSLIWLAIGCGVGIAVLVLCFVDKKNMERNIQEKLGNGFSRAPFATVVAVCTAVSIVACVPLGELFFFHMILIKKGITTYEYVVAMRAMSEAPPGSVDEEAPNPLYSPTNSATTGLSVSSSLSIHYKGAWCTPPRVFVDQQDEIVPHLEPGMVPSTVDPDAGGNAERPNKSKKAVKLSAWKLAKLDSHEAIKAAAKARASSSVLRPVDARRAHDAADFSSSTSGRSSVSMDYSAAAKEAPKGQLKLFPMRNSSRSHTSKDDYETGTQSASSLSSPSHAPEPVSVSSYPLPRPAAVAPDRPPPPPFAAPRGPPSGQQHTANTMFQSATATVRESKRASSVVWDQEAGRYVSVAGTNRFENAMAVPARPSLAPMAANSSSAEAGAYQGRRGPQANPATMPQQRERLAYMGQSIFFGGPLLNASAADDARRNADGTRKKAETQRGPNVGRGDARERTGQAADSFPVFAPGAFQKNLLSISSSSSYNK